jgi:hypothetical protein
VVSLCAASSYDGHLAVAHQGPDRSAVGEYGKPLRESCPRLNSRQRNLEDLEERNSTTDH